MTSTSDMRFGTVNAELNGTYRLRALPNLKLRGGLRMTAVLPPAPSRLPRSGSPISASPTDAARRGSWPVYREALSKA